MTTEITTDELTTEMESGGVLLIDALPAHAFQSRHLPGAVNLTVEDLEGDETLLPDTGARVVVYSTDDHCDRAPTLAAALVERGLTDVREYREGIVGWLAAGRPVESGA